MIKTLYDACEKMGWNTGRSFPLEKLFQKNLRKPYELILPALSVFTRGDYNLLEEDVWDYIVVLDACRYDTFAENNTIKGELSKKYSIASATMEWAKRAIKHSCKDIILINSNPYLSNLKLYEITGITKPFYKNVKAWDIGWDDELDTVPPWAMIEIAKKRLKKFPDKKFIFWFNQPHHPFLFSNGEGYTYLGKNEMKRTEVKSIWSLLSANRIDIDIAKVAYAENLVIALKEVKDLIEYLEGKIIITSDHGNCFGELGLFGHPQLVHIPPLIEVPYLIVEK